MWVGVLHGNVIGYVIDYVCHVLWQKILTGSTLKSELKHVRNDGSAFSIMEGVSTWARSLG